MANQSKRNRFRAPVSADYTILDGNGDVYGHLRIKPSNILWKPKYEHKWRNVTIDDFHHWMTSSTKARKTKR
jgi:hypothetical protein